MKIFVLNQRVVVTRQSHPLYLQVGTVRRLLHRDESAWISFDKRTEGYNWPFPANDEAGRGTHANVFPEDCEKP